MTEKNLELNLFNQVLLKVGFIKISSCKSVCVCARVCVYVCVCCLGYTCVADVFSTIFIFTDVEEVVDTVKEAGASRAQIMTIQRERNQTLLFDHHPVLSEVTDHASVVHESKPVAYTRRFVLFCTALH